MNSFIGIITLAAAYATQILAFIFSIYAFFISSFGWFYNDSKRKFVPAKRFALLIPAHNEENVIECIIDSLYHSDYPKELYDIFVIADNCTDQTAMLSRNRGVTVYQRNHDTKIGKGYALEWAFNILLQSETPYDAAAIFDADNVVAPDFLKEMNNKLCEGHQVIQGYVDSKNPFDSWITCAYSICFWAATRLLQIPRHNLGLSCSLWGTGFVVDMNVLKEIGWNATCLTEDLEFSTKLVLNNYKVAWAQHATVYDEKPLSLLHSWHQRKRWMQGHADIRKRYLSQLLIKGLEQKSWCVIDYAFSLMQHIKGSSTFIIFVTACIQTVLPNGHLGIIQIKYLFPDAHIWFFLLFMEIIYPPAMLMVHRKLTWKVLVGYATVYPIFLLTYIPITFQGILDKDKREWKHTPHKRKISIKELMKEI